MPFLLNFSRWIPVLSSLILVSIVLTSCKEKSNSSHPTPKTSPLSSAMSNDAPSTSLEIDSNVKIEKEDTSESREVSDKPSKGNAEEASSGEKDLWNMGKVLFQSKCASCHHPLRDGWGPALSGVRQRWIDDGNFDDKTGEEWLYAWIRNNKQVLDAGHPYANALYKDWGEANMNLFAGLKDEDIDALLYYVSNSNQFEQYAQVEIEESELDFKIDVDKRARQNAYRIYIGFKENEGDVYVEFPQGKNKYISEEHRIVNVDEVIREIEGGQGRDNNALQQAAEIFAKNVMEERGLEIDLANVDIILTVARHAPIKTVLEVKHALADQGFRRVFHRMENNN